MADTTIWIIPTVSLVFIGLLTSMSDECTESDIDNCTYTHQNHNNCAFYKRTVQCLEDIGSNCTDDRMIEKLTHLKDSNKRKADMCPGLPEGYCYFNVIALCEERVPFDIKYSTFFSDENRKKVCDHFKEKIHFSKTCLENIKEHCVEKHIHQQIDGVITRVEEIREICGYRDYN